MITPKHLIENADKYPDKPALSFKDESGIWVENSWSDFYNSTKIISKSLIACGINKNDKVSIYSYNRKEWVECYAALQFINASAVGVYHTCSSSEVDWIVNNSDSKRIKDTQILLNSTNDFISSFDEDSTINSTSLLIAVSYTHLTLPTNREV